MKANTKIKRTLKKYQPLGLDKRLLRGIFEKKDNQKMKLKKMRNTFLYKAKRFFGNIRNEKEAG